MDFITQLPTTSKRKISVLTIVYSLSKSVRLIPTRDDVTAEGVAKLFFDFIVSQFGLPRCIVSDRGTKFTSVFWQRLIKQVSTTLKMSTVDHPHGANALQNQCSATNSHKSCSDGFGGKVTKHRVSNELCNQPIIRFCPVCT